MISYKYLHVFVLHHYNKETQKMNFEYLNEAKKGGVEFLFLITDTESNVNEYHCSSYFTVNIHNISFLKIREINKIFSKYDYIIWHGLYLSGKWYLFFYFFRKYVAKFIWISQSVDLYNWKRKNNKLSNILYNYFGDKFRKQIQYFASVIINDCVYWEKNINQHGRPFLVNYFQRNWLCDINKLIKRNNNKRKHKLKFLIGLGSSKFDQHIQLLNILIKYRYDNIKIILINDGEISNIEYFTKVNEYAKLMFGNKVTILKCKKFSKKYFSILNSTDIVLTNIKNNITHYDYQYESICAALFLKKIVFLSNKNNLTKYLQSKKIKIYKLEDMNSYSFLELKKIVSNTQENDAALKEIKDNIKYNKYWANLFSSLDYNNSYFKFLHIIRPSVELSLPIMTIITEKFNSNDHRFLIRRRINSSACEKFMELPIVDLFLIGKTRIKRFIYFYRKLKACDIIIWHGLYIGYGQPVLSLKELAFLCLFPKFLDKIAWVGWGIDLYQWEKKTYNYFTIKNIFINCINKLSYRTRLKINYFISIFPPDAESFKDQFGQKNNALIFDGTYSNPYFITNIEESKPLYRKKYPTVPLRIMLGHSANEYNDHYYLLDLLAKYRYENIKIYLPLSTGPNRKYAKEVENYGKKLYGNKMVAINNKMPLKKYLEFLWYMDIAIFNIKNQAAVGNLMNLFYMRKKIFLPRDGLMYKFFKSKDIEVFDTNDIVNMKFIEFSSTTLKPKPPEYILERVDYEKNCKKWEKIFNKIYEEYERKNH